MRHLVLFLSCALAGLSSAEDLTIVTRFQEAGAPPRTGTTYVSADRMRVAQPDNQDFLAEFASGRLTMVDHGKKEYWTTTAAEVEAAMAKMQAQFRQVEEQMKNMPPALREKMGGMMGGLAAALEVKKAGPARTVAGYACETWTVHLGDMMTQEQCLTTQVRYPVQAWDAFKKVYSGMTAGPLGKGFADMYDRFKEMNGLPLATTSTMKVMGKTRTSSSEVTEVRRGSIPESAWALPAGYKKVDSPMSRLAR
jgi:hypothetical protein